MPHDQFSRRPPADGIAPDRKSTQYEEVATRFGADRSMVGRVTMQLAKGRQKLE